MAASTSDTRSYLASQAVLSVDVTQASIQGDEALPGSDAEYLSGIQVHLLKILYADDQHPLVKNAVAAVEATTNVKRERLFYGFTGALAVYLVIGALAQLVCNLIGFAYPAYASIRAVRTDAKDDHTQWLVYWVVFSAFSLIDFVTAHMLLYFPYWLCKAVFLLYLALPQTRGAIKLYNNVLDPTCDKVEALAASYLADINTSMRTGLANP
ncbi:TB2/DP1 proteinHVA22 family protein [Aphelenchoides avenae]|nr:TB2/DP1 proteinHVA22 family protein [Aphelenchus avenae]